MSSMTPSAVVNSCCTPSIWMAVAFAPSSDESSTRRMQLPKRVAVATLERFHDETRDSVVDFFRCYRRPHELCHSCVSLLTMPRLFRVKFDDELFANVQIDLIALRESKHVALQFLDVDLEPGRHLHALVGR